jgi:hypothetical protein
MTMSAEMTLNWKNISVRHLSLHVSVISVVHMEGVPVNIQQSAKLHMLLLHLLIERSTQSGDINLET